MEFFDKRVHILNRSGFTLVELMVTAGILLIVILGLSVAMRSALKSGSSADWMVEQAELLKEAQNVLSSPTLCTNALTGTAISIGSTVPVSLTPNTCNPSLPASATNCAPSGQGIYSGANYDGKTNIKSLELTNVAVVDAANNSYQADIVLKSQLVGTNNTTGQNEAIYGNSEFDRTLRVYFTIAGGSLPSTLSDCLGAWSNDAQTNCTIVGGTWINGHCDMCTAMNCTLNADNSCSCAAANCTVPAGMPWTIGSNTCTADATVSIPNGTNGNAIDSINPTTGSGNYSCSAGTLTFNSGASVCNMAQCRATTLSWVSGRNTCSGPVGITNGGSTSSIITSTTPAGSATFQCQNDGTWAASPNAGSTCSSTTSCPSQSTWAWGSCSGSLSMGSSAVGTVTSAITNTTRGYTGSASFTCSGGGSWVENSGATCRSTGGRCAGGSGTLVDTPITCVSDLDAYAMTCWQSGAPTACRGGGLGQGLSIGQCCLYATTGAYRCMPGYHDRGIAYCNP